MCHGKHCHASGQGWPKIRQFDTVSYRVTMPDANGQSSGDPIEITNAVVLRVSGRSALINVADPRVCCISGCMLDAGLLADLHVTGRVAPETVQVAQRLIDFCLETFGLDLTQIITN